LRELDLSDIKNVISSLASVLPLTSIHLMKTVGDSVISELMEHGSSLEALSLPARVNNDARQALIAAAPNLTSLKCSYLPHSVLSINCLSIKNCTKLTTLKLQGTVKAGNVSTLRKLSVGILPQWAPNNVELQRLVVTREPSDLLMKKVLQNCTKLQSLTITGSSYAKMHHNDVFLAASMMPSMEELWLRGSYGISDKGLAQIVKIFPNLKVLQLRGTYHRFTDYSLSLLGKLRNLQVLDLGGVKETTDESLPYILKAFPALRRLDICGWNSITQEAFEKLEQECFMRGIQLNPWNVFWRSNFWETCQMDPDMAEGISFYKQD
jgi:hypothetical protein